MTDINPTDTTLQERMMISQSTNIAGSGAQMGSLAETLSVSLVLLFFISLLKYHIEHRNETKDYWSFCLELPIDIGTVLISVFITYNYLVSSINCFLIILFLQLGAMAVEMILRNIAIEDYIHTGNDIQSNKLIRFLIGEVLVMAVPIVLTIILI